MTQSVAAVKVWHIVLAAALVLAGVAAYCYFTFDNIVESGSGEKFIVKSFGKPLKKDKATVVANKAVEEKAKN